MKLTIETLLEAKRKMQEPTKITKADCGHVVEVAGLSLYKACYIDLEYKTACYECYADQLEKKYLNPEAGDSDDS